MTYSIKFWAVTINDLNHFFLSLNLQTLSVGSDSNGSGVVALLEIARLFSALYSNPKTRGRYNLLFGLTSGGPYNYNGTQKVHHSFPKFLSCPFKLQLSRSVLWMCKLSSVASEFWPASTWEYRLCYLLE